MWSFPWKAADWFLFHLHLQNRDQKSELNPGFFTNFFQPESWMASCADAEKVINTLWNVVCGQCNIWRLGSVRDGRWTVKDMCSPGRLPDNHPLSLVPKVTAPIRQPATDKRNLWSQIVRRIISEINCLFICKTFNNIKYHCTAHSVCACAKLLPTKYNSFIAV